MNNNFTFTLNQLLLNNLIHGESLQKTLFDIQQTMDLNIFILEPLGQLLLYAAKEDPESYFLKVYQTDEDFICCDPSEEGFLHLEDGDCRVLPPNVSTPYFTIYYPVRRNDNSRRILAIKFSNPEIQDSVKQCLPNLALLCRNNPDNLEVQSSRKSSGLATMIARGLLLYNNDIAESANDNTFRIQYEALQKQNTVAASFQPPFIIAAFAHRPQTCATSEQYCYAMTAIEQHFPNSFSLVHHKTLLTFFYNTSQQKLEELRSIAYQEQLYVGISDPFESLNDRALFKQQALAILGCGRKYQRDSYVFQHLQSYRNLVLDCAIQEIGAEPLILSDVQTLVEYDRQNHTEYLNTLEEYLSCRNSLTLASKNLFINRGTLKYRLEKISGLIHANIEDAHTAETLGLSIAVYHAQQTLNDTAK